MSLGFCSPWHDLGQSSVFHCYLTVLVLSVKLCEQKQMVTILDNAKFLQIGGGGIWMFLTTLDYNVPHVSLKTGITVTMNMPRSQQC